MHMGSLCTWGHVSSFDISRRHTSTIRLLPASLASERSKRLMVAATVLYSAIPKACPISLNVNPLRRLTRYNTNSRPQSPYRFENAAHFSPRLPSTTLTTLADWGHVSTSDIPCMHSFTARCLALSRGNASANRWTAFPTVLYSGIPNASPISFNVSPLR